jgi:hypothetical protein
MSATLNTANKIFQVISSKKPYTKKEVLRAPATETEEATRVLEQINTTLYAYRNFASNPEEMKSVTLESQFYLYPEVPRRCSMTCASMANISLRMP